MVVVAPAERAAGAAPIPPSAAPAAAPIPPSPRNTAISAAIGLRARGADAARCAVPLTRPPAPHRAPHTPSSTTRASRARSAAIRHCRAVGRSPARRAAAMPRARHTGRDQRSVQRRWPRSSEPRAGRVREIGQQRGQLVAVPGGVGGRDRSSVSARSRRPSPSAWCSRATVSVALGVGRARPRDRRRGVAASGSAVARVGGRWSVDIALPVVVGQVPSTVIDRVSLDVARFGIG